MNTTYLKLKRASVVYRVLLLKIYIPAAFEAWASRGGSDPEDHKLTSVVRGAKMPLHLASIKESIQVPHNYLNTHVQQQNGNNKGQPLTIAHKWVVPIQKRS